MSRDAVMQFVNQTESSADLKQALKDTRGLQGIANLAREHGYEFGVEELQPVVDMLRFVDDASRDQELTKALATTTSGAAVVELAKSRGYEFSTAELEYLSVADQELSDADLENVAGGAGEITNSLRVNLNAPVSRTSPGRNFADVAARGLSNTADAMMSAGQLASPYIPGGVVLSAAVSG